MTGQENDHDDGVAQENQRDVEQRELHGSVLVELSPDRLELPNADKPASGTAVRQAGKQEGGGWGKMTRI